MIKAPKLQKLNLKRNPLGDIALVDAAGRPLPQKELRAEVADANAISAKHWAAVEARQKKSS